MKGMVERRRHDSDIKRLRSAGEMSFWCTLSSVRWMGAVSMGIISRAYVLEIPFIPTLLLGGGKENC